MGSSTTANSGFHAFLYENGAMMDLGTLAGKESSAIALNSKGQVIGRFYAPNGYAHPFLFSDGVMTDLGTLGHADSSATAINNKGQVVGYFTYELVYHGAFYHAFLYSDGVLTDLGTLGGISSFANDLNDNGEVVGRFTIDDQTSHAFLLSNDVLTDLNDLSFTTPLNTILGNAKFINDAGQIVVEGRSAHDYLLSPVTTPIPEPGSYGLIAGGLTLLMVLWRRKRADFPQLF